MLIFSSHRRQPIDLHLLKFQSVWIVMPGNSFISLLIFGRLVGLLSFCLLCGTHINFIRWKFFSLLPPSNEHSFDLDLMALLHLVAYTMWKLSSNKNQTRLRKYFWRGAKITDFLHSRNPHENRSMFTIWMRKPI